MERVGDNFNYFGQIASKTLVASLKKTPLIPLESLYPNPYFFE